MKQRDQTTTIGSDIWDDKPPFDHKMRYADEDDFDFDGEGHMTSLEIQNLSQVPKKYAYTGEPSPAVRITPKGGHNDSG